MARTPPIPSSLTSGSDTTNASSYVTAAIAPAANALVLLVVLVTRAGASPPTPTVTGNGLTWTLVRRSSDFAVAATTGSLCMFRAQGAAPSSGPVTIDYGGVSEAGALWQVEQFVDVPVGNGGADAIVQSVGVDSGGVSVTTLTSTLAALEDDLNVHFAAVAISVATGITNDGNFVEVADVTMASPSAGLETELAANARSCQPTFASARAVMVSVEVKAGGTDDAADAPPRLYITAGQSNDVGGADVLDLPAAYASYANPLSGVQIKRYLGCDTFGSPCSLESGWLSLQGHPPEGNPGSDSRFHGVELSLGRVLMKRWGAGNVYILVHATTGTDLAADWDPDATSGLRLYSRMIAAALAAQAELGATIAGFVWIQGNRDTTLANAPLYGDRLRNLIDRVRTDLGEPNLPFVYDQLSPYADLAYKAVTREEQAGVEIDPDYIGTVRMVRTEGLELRDLSAHYSSESFVELGLEMGRVLLELESAGHPGGES